ncbi:MAG: LLM class flavin-dependent oxidoreductase [Cryobacterium sp.]|uniref:LLM class flavin-dependent oxidoreductase n=1 Tax=unclassified Cryobacterium TaxID=2649013 RepID=UPI0018C9727E|nr:MULTISPECIES: LLM class flavin-dependent oxidoreductase [unclassified Cryobacterium]MCY7405709.1 LLM class flavin-dependent oxidoreductase [Cryobacterium sp.]MEC5155137.1 alkanesulfonate monooxygenase SsuD/methylene tetrahydromethanopterin reductase-like flavin-dependent oxidoreductase (luciferase family) [Cryobacterium sp. CAN_C3]
MRFGIVILPQDPWPIARRKWLGAEQYGFDHAFTYDHLSWRSLADEPWNATIPTLTAAAVVTERITLGTFVSSPNFRHPVPFAKDVATADDVSGGRFLLGIGSGGTGFDASVLGQAQFTPRLRHERFVEFVTDLDLLLRGEEQGATDGISFAGEWYTADHARMVQPDIGDGDRQRVPFLIAANGPKGLGLASRFGQGWVTTGQDGAEGEDWWTSVRALTLRLDDVVSGAGRDPAAIDRYLSLDSGGTYSLQSMNAFEDAVGRAAELGFTDVISHWPREHGLYAGDEGILDTVAGALH